MSRVYSPKEIAIYQAVVELLEEGSDLNNLTVAEITGKAGIGKGTAYEYFSDKEEMIAKAILYNGEMFCRHIYHEMCKEKSLYDKINLILHTMEEQTENMNCLFRLMQVISDNSMVSQRLCEFKQEQKDDKEDEILPVYLVKQILRNEFQGKAPLSKERTDYLVLCIFSKFFCYGMLLREEYYHHEDKKMIIRELICREICREIENSKGDSKDEPQMVEGKRSLSDLSEKLYG